MAFTIDFSKAEDCGKIYQLNLETFGESIAVDYEHVKSWFDVNPYQWLVAKDEEDNLLGFVNISHVKDETFNDIICGRMSEKDIRMKDIIPLGTKGKIFCYLQGFVVKNKNTRVAISLLNKALAYARFLKEKGIQVEKVGTMAVTRDGTKLCEKAGFKAVREEILSDGTKEITYVLDFNDENYSRLVNNIKEIFLDTKGLI